MLNDRKSEWSVLYWSNSTAEKKIKKLSPLPLPHPPIMTTATQEFKFIFMPQLSTYQLLKTVYGGGGGGWRLWVEATQVTQKIKIYFLLFLLRHPWFFWSTCSWQPLSCIYSAHCNGCHRSLVCTAYCSSCTGWMSRLYSQLALKDGNRILIWLDLACDGIAYDCRMLFRGRTKA